MDYDNEIIEDGCEVTISRNRLQILCCENMALAIPKASGQPKKKAKDSVGKYHAQNYAKRMKSRAKTVKSICYNSFEPEGAAFVTLTFDPKQFPEKNLTKCEVTHPYFKLFIKRMNDHYEGFKYIAIFAQQGNRNWHYHMLCNLDSSVTVQEIRQRWGYGKLTMSAVCDKQHFKNVINYLVENMMSAAEELEGRKAYLCSRNVERDIVLKSWRREQNAQLTAVMQEIPKGERAYLNCTSEIHAGLMRETLDPESGEILEEFIPNEQMNEERASQGYEECVTKYELYSSPVRFSEMFKPLKTASLRPKKFKHKPKK